MTIKGGDSACTVKWGAEMVGNHIHTYNEMLTQGT